MSAISNIFGLDITSLFQVFLYLEREDLANCRCVSRFFKDAASSALYSNCRALVGRLGIPLSPLPHETQIEFSNRAIKAVKVLTLKKTIAEYPKEQIPPDIDTILKIKTPPSEEQIKRLEAFIKARDILVVCNEIVKSIYALLDLTQMWQSSDSVLELSKDFSTWCE